MNGMAPRFQKLDDLAGRKARAALEALRADPMLAAFGGAALLVLLLALPGIGSEWDCHHEGWYGAQSAIEADDNLRAVFGRGSAEKTEPHPPGFSFLLSLTLAVLGRSEAAARLLAVELTVSAFLMLVFALRRSWGREQTLLGCLFLALTPVFVSTMAFVADETLVLFSMAALLWAWESYRLDRRRWKIALLGASVLVGAFSGTGWYFFVLPFLVFVSISELRQGPGRWKMPLLLLGMVVLAGALLVLQQAVAHGSLAAFGRYLSREITKPSWAAVMAALRRWDGYVGFFTPMVPALVAFFLVDLSIRLALLRLNRGDGHLIALLLAATAAWLTCPSAGSHDYAVAVFAPPLAMAAGAGLWRLSDSLSHGSLRMRGAVCALVLAAFAALAAPQIYRWRVSAVYEFTEPLHKIAFPAACDRQAAANAMARYLGGFMKPDERLAVFTGFEIRPGLRYYLDHRLQVFTSRLDVLGLESRKAFAFLLVSKTDTWSDVLAHLLARHDAVFLDRAVAVDLRHRVGRIVVLERAADGKARVEENPWRSLDAAVALDRAPQADALWKKLAGARRDTLPAAVAAYNYARWKGAAPDEKKLTAMLQVVPKVKTVFGKSVEYLGARLWKRGDGRTVLQMLVRPVKALDVNVKVNLTAEARHEDETLRSEIGTKTLDLRFQVPSTLWKAGSVVLLEEALPLYPGPYRLSFEISWIDYFQVLNTRSNENAFPVACRQLPGNPLDSLAEVTARMMELDAKGVQDPKDVRRALAELGAYGTLDMEPIGDDLVLHGCSVVPTSTGKWLMRLFFQNRSMAGRDISVTVTGTGGGGNFQKTLPLGKMLGDRGPGRLFWVEDTFDIDPSASSVKIVVGGASIENPLGTNLGITKLSIGEGSYGTELPLSWIDWPSLL
jgi:4-amino-4-deoxy-L-arabinose transferase-like glycosyltransferase